jgi:hypothetical protein
MNKCKSEGHDAGIKIWGICRTCFGTGEPDWRQEYEDAITERNLLIIENTALKERAKDDTAKFTSILAEAVTLLTEGIHEIERLEAFNTALKEQLAEKVV